MWEIRAIADLGGKARLDKVLVVRRVGGEGSLGGRGRGRGWRQGETGARLLGLLGLHVKRLSTLV